MISLPHTGKLGTALQGVIDYGLLIKWAKQLPVLWLLQAQPKGTELQSILHATNAMVSKEPKDRRNPRGLNIRKSIEWHRQKMF